MNDEILEKWKEKTKGLFNIVEWTRFWNYITNLEQENEKWWAIIKDYEMDLHDLWFKNNELEESIEKAVEYIENNEVCCLEYIGRNEITGNLEKQIQRDLVNRTDLLNILNGKE